MEYGVAMRLHLKSFSVVIAMLGCAFFCVGGFMLFPVALDLWEHGTAEKPSA